MFTDELLNDLEKITNKIHINLSTRKCVFYLSPQLKHDIIEFIHKLENTTHINTFLKNNLNNMFSTYVINKQLLKYSLFLIFYDRRTLKNALRFYYYSFFSAQFKKFIPHCNPPQVLNTWSKLPIRSLFSNAYSYADVIDLLIEKIIEKMKSVENDNNLIYNKFVLGVNTLRQSLRVFANTYHKLSSPGRIY